MLTEEEIVAMSKYAYYKQIEQIAEGLKQVHDRTKSHFKQEIPVVVTGLGREFLAKKAAMRVDFSRIVNLGDLLGTNAALVSTAVGVALMVATELGRECIQWRQL
jgi:hypothetical protein